VAPIRDNVEAMHYRSKIKKSSEEWRAYERIEVTQNTMQYRNYKNTATAHEGPALLSL